MYKLFLLCGWGHCSCAKTGYHATKQIDHSGMTDESTHKSQVCKKYVVKIGYMKCDAQEFDHELYMALNMDTD
uniref:Uncharacterized protein n=1 Tax=Arundo donax TaxID=35708 RepID=A0A0A9ETC3_ARUDO